MAIHNDVGAWGEGIAREFLLAKGYAIGEENLKVGNYEIDFIARKDDRIVFVEVKTRSSRSYDPLDAVDRKKIARLVRAADEYLRARQERLEPQFDIIAVVGSATGGYEVEHFPDAFFPPLQSYR
ncbi:MAG: YraN family protein [Barnesiella sp.]|nr:YraN family protein [Barnesiella sp.]